MIRKLWLASKTYGVPITHPYIQGLTATDLSLIDWSTVLDKPGMLDKIKNTVVDDDFDAYWDETMNSENTESNEEDTSSSDDEDNWEVIDDE